MIHLYLNTPRRKLIAYTTYAVFIIPMGLIFIYAIITSYKIPNNPDLVRVIIEITFILIGGFHPFLLSFYLIYMWKSLKQTQNWKFPSWSALLILFYPFILYYIYNWLYASNHNSLN